MTRWKKLTALGSAFLCVGLTSGCFVAADLVNPSLLASFGLDPEALNPTPGRVIIALNNQTSFPATFRVGLVDDTGDTTFSIREVEASTTGNVVGRCPVAQVLFTSAGNASSVSINASTGSGDNIETVTAELSYAGGAITSGDVFNCGDIVELELTQVAGDAGDADAFQLRVRVIPSN